MTDFFLGVLAFLAAIFMFLIYVVIVALVWAVVIALVIAFLKVFGIDVLGAVGL